MLYVKKSQVPRAGKGLYTDSFIEKGTLIVEYLGEIITWKEAIKRAEEGKGGYVFYITSKYCIDAYNTPQHLARYANDARGTKRKSKLRNNCVYSDSRYHGYIEATRNIKPGEEILVWYGPDYWKEHEQEMIDFRKKRRAEAAKRARLKKKKSRKSKVVGRKS